MISRRRAALGRAATLVAAAAILLPAHADARDTRFSFRTAEFLPAEGRLPAARAFMARSIRLGMPLSAAIAAVQGAGARCEMALAPVVRCSYAAMQRPPEGQIQDVVWTVHLVSSTDGKIAGADVTRAVYGL